MINALFISSLPYEALAHRLYGGGTLVDGGARTKAGLDAASYGRSSESVGNGHVSLVDASEKRLTGIYSGERLHPGGSAVAARPLSGHARDQTSSRVRANDVSFAPDATRLLHSANLANQSIPLGLYARGCR